MKGKRKRDEIRTWMLGALVIACVLFAAGCAKFSTERGVEDHWRSPEVPVFNSGSTTQADILEALGPPSQIISLNSGSVFYYLREKGQGKGLILIVYNQINYSAAYDRAIFFFDDQGVLTEYSYSSDETQSM